MNGPGHKKLRAQTEFSMIIESCRVHVKYSLSLFTQTLPCTFKYYLSFTAKPKSQAKGAHLNRDKIESILSVPRIQGCYENGLCMSFEISPLLICL